MRLFSLGEGADPLGSLGPTRKVLCNGRAEAATQPRTALGRMCSPRSRATPGLVSRTEDSGSVSGCLTVTLAETRATTQEASENLHPVLP